MSDILNRKAFSDWANERRQLGHDIAAIKGLVPGQFYSDGDPVTGPMNVGWKDVVTGEVFAFEFVLPEGRAIALLKQEGGGMTRRFSFTQHGMQVSDAGAFVSYEEHEELQSKLAELREAAQAVSYGHWHERSYLEMRPRIRKLDDAMESSDE